MSKICEYGCGQESKYQFKNGKWCCSKHTNQCPVKRREHSIRIKKEWKDSNSEYNSISYRENLNDRLREERENPNSRLNSILCREKLSNIMKEKWEYPNSKYNSISCRGKMSKSSKISVKQIKDRYPFFSQIEEMRYNPDKPEEKEIQVHCKNHLCENSKEKGGWFTPTKRQLFERTNTIKNPRGFGESNFYCSQYCKDTCYLYYLRSDPFRNAELPYTQAEYNNWISEVLERQIIRDKYNFCEKCYSTKNLHVHHEKPVKTHPYLALDPDNGIVLCKDCHYKYGHKTGTECSTGALANKVLPGCRLGGQK